MKIRHFIVAQLSTALIILSAAPSPASDNPAVALWKDPTFQKQFLGSYGFQAEIEPKVAPTERLEMEKILPLMTSDLPGATKQLEAIIKPESSAVLDFTLGNLYFQQDKSAQAAERFKSALQKFPSFRRAHKNLALIHIREGKFDESVASFTRVIELGGGDAITYGLLGYAYSTKEDYLSAESAYRSALLFQPDSLDWKMGMARCILKQQKYGEAAALFDGLIETHPDRAEFWLLQANAYLGMKEPMKAAQNYEILDRLGKATLDTLNTLGDIYVNEGSFDLARRAYARAMEADPRQAPTRPLRAAEILAARGAMTQAKELLVKMKSVVGDKPDEETRKKMLKLEGRIAASEGTGEDAARVLEQIVAMDPLDGESLMLLGRHHGRAGNPEKAIFYYERAAGIEACEADAKVRHAQLLVSQSKFHDSLPLLRRAQEIKPREAVAKYLDQVERIVKNKK